MNNEDLISKSLYYKPETYKRKTKKIGRNEQCPCGSGLKYKKCCLNPKPVAY